MFCPRCGANVPNNEMYCRNCGTQVAAPQQQAYNNNQYQNNQYQSSQNYATQNQYSYSSNNYANPVQQALPMKWYKFLIYFSLIFGGIMNCFSGLAMIIGAHYDGDAEFVYEVFDGLQGLDIVAGLAIIAVGVLQIYTRFRLAGFKKDGPKMLSWSYLSAIAVNVIYIIGIYVVLGDVVDYINTDDLTFSYVMSALVSIAFLCANNTYFKKREHLFVNQ